MIIYYILTILLYGVYASVPYWNLDNKTSVALCVGMSAIGGLLWGLIQSKSNLQDISLNGLMFDLIITSCFFVVPILIFKQNISSQGYFGVLFILTGIVLIKN